MTGPDPPSTSEDVAWLDVDDASAAGTARRAAADMAARLGFSGPRAAEIGLAATEVATNLHRHAGGGTLAIRRLRLGDSTAVQLVAIDQGPGMSDAGGSARDGQSTTGTLGVGIGAIQRLSTAFDTWSAPGHGTVLAATFGPATRAAARARSGPGADPRGPASAAAAALDPARPWAPAGITRPMTGQEECGDGWSCRLVDGRLQILLADGLGHGSLAADASRAAVQAFLEAPASSPAGVLAVLHQAIRHTRGAAAAVLEVDPADRTGRMAGIGNIGVWIEVDGARRGLLCRPGIIGHRSVDIRDQPCRLPEGALVVLHSDGVRDRWDLTGYPGLRSSSPVVMSAVLLRDWGVQRDDACVVVLRC